MTRAGAARSWLPAAPAALLALLSASLAWHQHGSIAVGDWALYAALGSLIVTTVLVSGSAALPPPAAILGLAALLALGVWDAVSATWSAVPALARDEALLAVFYALVLAVPLLSIRREWDRRAATGTAVAFLAILAVGTIVAVRIAHDPTADYQDGRLTFPISYVNAEGALQVIGFFPAIALAADRALSPLARALALGGGTAMLAGWLLTQSKGAGLSLLAGAVFLVAASSSRLRVLVALVVPAALVGAAYSPLTEPFRRRNTGMFADAIRSATSRALVLAAVATVIGFAYALLDRRVNISPGVRRAAAVGAAVLAVSGALGGVAAFALAVDHPGRFLHDRWASFKRLPPTERGSSHLVSLGSNRYDFWRVDLHMFADHPLGGIGARGFGSAYLQRRRSDETPQRGHSLELDVLAETGIVGFVLLLSALGGGLVAAIPPSRRSLTAAGCGAAAASWIVHTAADWIWTIPASGAAAFLFMGLAAARDGPRSIPNRAAVPLAAMAVVLALLAFAPPWLSARLTRNALANRGSAAGDLRWARRLDPLSVDPYVVESAIARNPAEAVAPLRRAVAKQPREASLHYALGLVELRAGESAAARRELAEAQRLDPRDDLISRALERARAAG
jgi:O-antigen ligase